MTSYIFKQHLHLILQKESIIYFHYSTIFIQTYLQSIKFIISNDYELVLKIMAKTHLIGFNHPYIAESSNLIYRMVL